MGNHSNYLTVSSFLRLKHFLCKTLYQIKRMLKAVVIKRELRAFVNFSAAKPKYIGLIYRHLPKHICKRRFKLAKSLTVNTAINRNDFCPDRLCRNRHNKFSGRFIALSNMAVKICDNHPHRRSIHKKVQKLILFSYVKTLILQLVHHGVKNVDHVVRLRLSHFS